MTPQILAVVDDKIVIDKLQLKWTEGSATHLGNFDIKGKFNVQQLATFESNLTVNGNLFVDTLTVKNLISENPSETGGGQWSANLESDLDEKGLFWTSGNSSSRFVYKQGKTLWSDANIELSQDNSFKINGATVLSSNSLGSGIAYSQLRKLGNLDSLTVNGNANLGDFAFFNSDSNRLGLGTEEPADDISIVSNNVEIGIGSPIYGLAVFGARSNHDVGITTDNTVRILVKNNGTVQIGEESTKTGLLKVYGRLEVDELVTDTRIKRSSSLEFVTNSDISSYGKGLVWVDGTKSESIILLPNPNRLQASTSIDTNGNYLIEGEVVLSKNDLGPNITKSNLSKLGVLESLKVDGLAEFRGSVTANQLTTNFFGISSSDNANSLHFNFDGINSQSSKFTINIKQYNIISADMENIVIGTIPQSSRLIKLYGNVSVGVQNPDPSVKLEVSGPVKFNNKKFVDGVSSPTNGVFSKGDVCWNTNPAPGNFIGWVCIISGDPGQWMPFGLISTQ